MENWFLENFSLFLFQKLTNISKKKKLRHHSFNPNYLVAIKSYIFYR